MLPPASPAQPCTSSSRGRRPMIPPQSGARRRAGVAAAAAMAVSDLRQQSRNTHHSSSRWQGGSRPAARCSPVSSSTSETPLAAAGEAAATAGVSAGPTLLSNCHCFLVLISKKGALSISTKRRRMRSHPVCKFVGQTCDRYRSAASSAPPETPERLQTVSWIARASLNSQVAHDCTLESLWARNLLWFGGHLG